MKSPGPGDALVVVDVQNDFVQGGALAVPRVEKVVGPLNRLIRRCSDRGPVLVFTRDWHPPDHFAFRSQEGPWSPHWVAPGAQFPPPLHEAQFVDSRVMNLLHFRCMIANEAARADRGLP